MQIRHLALAAGFLLGSAGVAAAAPALVTADLNMRAGPGTHYGVVDVLPGGSTVDVLSCGGSWCRVAFGSAEGYASRSYLSGERGPVYAEAPPVYVEPPVVGFGFGFGGGWRSHHGWHGGGHGGWHGGHRGHHR